MPYPMQLNQLPEQHAYYLGPVNEADVRLGNELASALGAGFFKVQCLGLIFSKSLGLERALSFLTVLLL